jgi:hypothetical protein
LSDGECAKSNELENIRCPKKTLTGESKNLRVKIQTTGEQANFLLKRFSEILYLRIITFK